MNNNNNNNMNKKENSKVSYFLSLIPSTIITLVASLSEEDRQVLAYLISCSYKNYIKNDNKAIRRHQYYSKNGSRDHLFECHCFECYANFWARWDASEKRHVIHDIIEAYEDHLDKKTTKIEGKSGTNKVKKSDKRKNSWKRVCDEPIGLSGVGALVKEEVEDLVSFKGTEEGLNNQVGTENKTSFRRFLSYVGDKVFALWL